MALRRASRREVRAAVLGRRLAAEALDWGEDYPRTKSLHF